MITRRKLTVENLLALHEAGQLDPDERLELLEGELYTMAPVGSKHAGIVDRLNRLLQKLVGDDAIVRNQNPIRLDDDTLPQPDLTLLKPRADYYMAAHPRPSDIYLVIEVSDSTLSSDRERKLPAYARAGIKELWLVNVPEEHVEVYRDPKGSSYRERYVLKRGEALAPLAFPESTLIILPEG